MNIHIPSLNPAVFERAAENIKLRPARMGRGEYFACDAIRSVFDDHAIAGCAFMSWLQYREYFAGLFEPPIGQRADYWCWWSDLPSCTYQSQMARKIALDLTALILRDEQKVLRHSPRRARQSNPQRK